MTKIFSQHDEQKFIEKFFYQKNGTFLDIGAYDGVTISNTYKLWLNGWHGTYVEPSVKSFRKLQKNIKKRCSLIHAAMGDVRKLSVFYDCQEDTTSIKRDSPIFGVSTLNVDQAESWTKGYFSKEVGPVNFSQYFVSCITWNDLIDAVGVNFDFINIDVEEYNQKILANMPLKKFKNLKLLCVEKEDGLKIDFLKDFRFNLVHETKSNYLFGRKLDDQEEAEGARIKLL